MTITGTVVTFRMDQSGNHGFISVKHRNRPINGVLITSTFQIVKRTVLPDPPPAAGDNVSISANGVVADVIRVLR